MPRDWRRSNFLPDQRLQKAAPLHERIARAADTGQTVSVAGGPYDQLLDSFPGIAEHLRRSGIPVLRRIEAARRAIDAALAPGPASSPSTMPATSPDPIDMAFMMLPREVSC